MHADTWNVRKDAKLLNDDRLADAIVVELRKWEVLGTTGVDDGTRTTDEIREAVFGPSQLEHVIYELNETIMDLTRPSGLVYQKLADYGDELSLCTTNVKRLLIDTDNGTSYVVSKTGRFVSKDDDVVAGYRLDPQFKRLERTIERVSALIAEDTRRIPALANHTPGMIARTHGVLQAELPAPATTNGKNGS